MPRTLLCLLFAVAAFSLVSCSQPAKEPCRNSEPVCRPLPSPPASMGRALYRRARKCGLPYSALIRAMRYLNAHCEEFANRRFLTIIDYTQPSTSKRLFLIDLCSCDIATLLVSHGKNSGELYATRFSNREDSLESPCGFFMTGPEYYGPHGASMVLYGLQKGVNDNSLSRKIVMHGAYYVSRDAIALNRRLHGVARLGLSEGCPAIPMQEAEPVIDRIKDGSLLYMYAGSAGR
ncbi:MAG: murein L,D-transpeptidase catalytic domain family protein [Syntrophobacteraceae bacterium]|nr:murein L,D-transpeptidase catalytic domain family protein [Syntrophobacteraceae bacterium]